jgi:hypothetical protein
MAEIFEDLTGAICIDVINLAAWRPPPSGGGGKAEPKA